MKEEILKQYWKLKQEGKSQREVCIILEIARSTLQGWIKDEVEEEQSSYVPKILIIDIENSPSEAYYWRRWKENISQDQVINEAYLLTYSAKWLGNPAIINGRVYKRDGDKQILEELHSLFGQADVVVAHNGKKHDFTMINSRMVYHGMKPYAPVKFYDTLEVARKNFKFPSNSLKSLAIYLGCSEKAENSGFDLWKRCCDMQDDAFVEMQLYNDQDVITLEEVYLKLRAWDAKAPNLNVYYNDDVKRCPVCGGKHLTMLDKLSYTQQSAFTTYQCDDCGKISRAKQNHRSKEAMKASLVSVIQ